MEEEQKQQIHNPEILGAYSRVQDYIIIRFLDRGAQGKVKLCQKIGEEKFYAIKIHKQNALQENDLEDMRREVQALQQVGNHDNILQLVEYYEDVEYQRKNNGGSYKCTCIILEFIQNGCLFDYVKAMGGFHSAIAKYFFKQHINALQHIHSKGICHRDIKLENTLLDDTFKLKICDFGFAGKAGEVLNDNLGTQTYKAFEINNRQPYYGEKVDIFSSGVCFFIFSFGHYPFSKASMSDKYYKMLIENNQQFWNNHIRTLQNNGKKSDFINDSFIKLMNGMLTNIPQDRWNCEQILNSQYMQQQEQVNVTQEIVQYNLDMYRQQVEQQRTQELQERRNNRVQNNQQHDNRPESRAVPKELVSDIENLQKQLGEFLPKETKFAKYDQLGGNNSFIKVVLGNDEVIPVIYYIFKNLQLQHFTVDDIKVSPNTCGKVKASFQDQNGQIIEACTQVQQVVEEKSDDSNLNIFNIRLVRLQGEYLEFRQLYEAFAQTALQFE